MTKVNIAEWSAEQVAAWLRGLNGLIGPYIPLFLARGVGGQQLLMLRSDDLESIGVHTIGHQELLLEAVEHLRNFHYELQMENLQRLAMRLSCVATSLHSELRHQDSNKVATQSLSALAHVIAAVKPLVCWLDRSPFFEQLEYSERKSVLLKLALEAATCAQRERFAERPTHAIAAACRQLAALADHIIQDVADPMILQPASLDSVVLKRKENQLGFDIVPSFSGHHQITNIKFGSPAHASGKIEEGDEIVQVNYQVVVGWCPELARLACLATPEEPNHNSQTPDLVLTLRRRPGARAAALATPQLRPFRPRRPWGGYGGNIMPNRIRFWDQRDVTSLRGIRVPSVEPTPEVEEREGSSSDESEILSPPGSPNTLERDAHHRLYLPKPRSQVHRRNTISGSSPISKRPNVSIEQFWRELKNHKTLNHTGSAQMSHGDNDDISNNLYRRDKAMSYSTGLELSPRPKTCLGVGVNHPIISKIKSKKDENANPTDEHKEASKNKGKLDKSHSTPAYDFDSNGNDDSNSLVTQIIPESPTTPSDSPTIVIHSAEKADQILDFKKSSSQIGEAILQQQKQKEAISTDSESSRGKVKFSFPDDDDFKEELCPDNKKCGQVDKIMETINIAMLERQNRERDRKITTKQSSYKAQSVFYTDTGEKSTKTFSVNEHIQTIQNEIVQAINEQKTITTMHITKTKQILSDLPPEPPPRPLSTQKPAYKEFLVPIKDHRMKDLPKGKNPDVLEPKDYPPLIPVKPESVHVPHSMKHITKEDIHVIPNIGPPMLPNRRDTLLTVGQTSPTADLIPMSVLSFEKKNSQFNVMSNPDLTSKSINLGSELTGITEMSPLTQSQSLQRLEMEGRPTLIIPSPSRMETPKVLSPSNSVVRGIFPSSKSKSLKKKNSILAKRRKVSVKDLGQGDLQGYLYQRCRTKSNNTVVWDQKWYVLQGNTMYGFKSKESTRADCLIFLNGFTVSPAQEVKSKQFAFRVYHTGTAFYFAAENAESMNAWYEYISKATMINYDSWERAHKKDKKVEQSKHFSETDYSDDDFSSDKDGSEKHKGEGKEKEKSKFGSLKKFTNRIHKTESHENVSHASTSLDRKYLRIFSKSKHKEDKSKSKNVDVPVPTEQYRSYRKIPSSNQPTIQIQQSMSFGKIPDVKDDILEKQNVAKIKKIDPITAEIDTLLQATKSQKMPKPVNYVHASNPNLLDFEKNDLLPKPFMNIPYPKPKIQRPDNMLGFVTLEQFMLKKQEEERKEVYSNRVLMGIERDSRKEDGSSSSKKAAKELQKQWENIIPDVIYGELPNYGEDLIPVSVEQIQNRSLPKTPEKQNELAKSHEYVHISDDIKNGLDSDNAKPISVKGKDGYEKIVYGVPNDIKKPEVILGEEKLEPPKILPRKPSLVPPDDNKTAVTPDILRKSSNASAKELGYETIYGSDKSMDSHHSSMPSSISAGQLDDHRILPRKMSDDRKPIPPPKIMPKSKQVLNRQSSLSSNPNRNSGPDMNPVFIQGESPEKFWLNSLRRNDKVHNNKTPEVAKNEKFFTKRSEPSMFTKSSEATIVKSDKMHKNIDHFVPKGGGGEVKVLKSATQYTPMSLPLNAVNVLKTSPKFEMTLDSKDPPVTSGISRLRQIFQSGGQSVGKLRPSTPSPTGSVKEKTILGSPRLHRAIFRKQHGTAGQPGDDFCQEFTFTKGSSVTGSCESFPQDGQGVFTEGALHEEMSNLRNMATPDYPHLEYPPTFEPEIYSLSDPTTSLNLLRKKNNPEKK